MDIAFEVPAVTGTAFAFRAVAVRMDDAGTKQTAAEQTAAMIWGIFFIVFPPLSLSARRALMKLLPGKITSGSLFVRSKL